MPSLIASNGLSSAVDPMRWSVDLTSGPGSRSDELPRTAEGSDGLEGLCVLEPLQCEFHQAINWLVGIDDIPLRLAEIVVRIQIKRWKAYHRYKLTALTDSECHF